MLCRIQDHLDDVFDITVSWCQAANFNSQAACDRGTYLISVELLAFNLALFENVLGQGVQHSFCPKQKAEPFHKSNQASLSMPHLNQKPGKAIGIPPEG